jgi:hypothetical protein
MTLLGDFLYRNGQAAQQTKGEEATTSASTVASSTVVDEHDQEERVPPEQPLQKQQQQHVSLKKDQDVAHDDDDNDNETGFLLRSRMTKVLVGIETIPHYSFWAMSHIVTMALLVWFAYTLVVVLGSILQFIQQDDSISGVLLWGTIIYLIVSEIGLDDD